MHPRSPAWQRFLGLWTAGWLAVLLVLGMLRFGDPAVQWPVLLVPAVWALAALRPRRRTGLAPEPGARRSRRSRREPETLEADRYPDDGYEDVRYDDRYDVRYDDRYDDRYEDDAYDDDPPPLPPGARTDTVERPALRRSYDPRENDRR